MSIKKIESVEEVQSVVERVAGRNDETNDVDDDQARTHLRLQCKYISVVKLMQFFFFF